MATNVTGMTPSVQAPERTQETKGEKISVRRDGGSGAGFAPRTDVSIKNSIENMAEVLSKISSHTSDAENAIPSQLKEIISNIMRSAFSLEATVSEGVGSSLASQKFSVEQLNTLSRMLHHLGYLSDQGSLGELSEDLQVVFDNLKTVLTKDSSMEAVNLNKLAFQLIQDEDNPQVARQLEQLLSQLTSLSVSQPVNSAPVQSEGLNFLNKLVDAFFPKSTFTGGGQQTAAGPSTGNAQMAGTPMGNQQMANLQMGNNQMTNSQMANPSMGNSQMSNTQAANSPAFVNTPSMASDITGNLNAGTNANAMANQGEAAPQGATANPNAAAQPSAQGNNANVNTPLANNAVNTGANGATSSNNSAPMSNTPMAETPLTPEELQNLPDSFLKREGGVKFVGESNSTNENVNVRLNNAGMAYEGTVSRQGAGDGELNPLFKQIFSRFGSPNNMPENAGNSSTTTQPSVVQMDNQQVATVLKDVGQLILKNADLSPKDVELLNNFINKTQGELPEQDAKQLNLLLRTIQSNIPASVQQAGQRMGLEELPKLWAFMQLCDLSQLKKMKGHNYRSASKEINNFVNSMKGSMHSEGSYKADGQKSISFMMPLYLGDGTTQSYPAYVHVYDEPAHEDEKGVMRKDTWFRVCVLTESIGAVDVVCRLYEGNNLNLRVIFSDKDSVAEFSEYLPDIRKALYNTPINLTDLKIGTVNNG